MTKMTLAAYRLQQARRQKLTLSKVDLQHGAGVQMRYWLRRILERRKEEQQLKAQREMLLAQHAAHMEHLQDVLRTTAAAHGIEIPREVRH